MSIMLSMKLQTIRSWAEATRPNFLYSNCETSHLKTESSSPVSKKRRLIARARSSAQDTVAATAVLPGTEQASAVIGKFSSIVLQRLLVNDCK